MTEPKTRTHQFLWFDLETTGLNPATDLVLEWALVLAADDAAGDMTVVEEYSAAIARTATQLAINTRHEVVQTMHRNSGLWDACLASDTTLAESDEFLLGVCQELTGQEQPRGLKLAGFSVHFDRAFVRHSLPKFSACLSHQVFDVSTLVAAARSWCGADLPVSSGDNVSHRASADIYAALERAAEFRCYLGAAE